MSDEQPSLPPIIPPAQSGEIRGTAQVSERPRTTVPYFVQALVGFGAYVGVLILNVIGIIAMQSGWMALPASLALISLCVVAWRRWHWRGFVTGALIGFGLSALAAGICAAMFSKGFGG